MVGPLFFEIPSELDFLFRQDVMKLFLAIVSLAALNSIGDIFWKYFYIETRMRTYGFVFRRVGVSVATPFH